MSASSGVTGNPFLTFKASQATVGDLESRAPPAPEGRTPTLEMPPLTQQSVGTSRQRGQGI